MSQGKPSNYDHRPQQTARRERSGDCALFKEERARTLRSASLLRSGKEGAQAVTSLDAFRRYFGFVLVTAPTVGEREQADCQRIGEAIADFWSRGRFKLSTHGPEVSPNMRSRTERCAEMIIQSLRIPRHTVDPNPTRYVGVEGNTLAVSHLAVAANRAWAECPDSETGRLVCVAVTGGLELKRLHLSDELVGDGRALVLMGTRGGVLLWEDLRVNY